MYTQHGFRIINFYRFLTHDIHDLKIALIFYFFRFEFVTMKIIIGAKYRDKKFEVNYFHFLYNFLTSVCCDP